MSNLDWIVMSSFLLFVVVYGVWKTRGKKDINGYILANKSTPWYAITLSIMATQASAITFLSTPGQAYADGMRFVQFYLGLPIAMVIISIVVVPQFHKLKVYTAYEYLETRFDLKNRTFGSVLFLMHRALACGFTIFAPALIISVILGWDIRLTIFMIGGIVIVYTTTGGTDAVHKTHLLQMAIITVGMGAAFIMIFRLLPPDISFLDAAHVAGKMGKLNVINFAFDLKDRYNIWSGLIGGTCLFLSYFGADQSQVQRYLSGRSIAQSRVGLLANGVFKIPMQFAILLTGAMIFVFYQFVTPPLSFNPVETAKIKDSAYSQAYQDLETRYEYVHKDKQAQIRDMLEAINSGADSELDLDQTVQMVHKSQDEESKIKDEAAALMLKADPSADTNDINYIFLSFVTKFLPVGLIGLILAAILSASMSSTAAELNALASVTIIDIYKRIFRKKASDRHYLLASKVATVIWGIYAINFALFANRLGSLIEAVNILGSLFYGTILGIFVVAFLFKRIGGNATFFAALISESVVLSCYIFTDIPYLWYNVIGPVVIVTIAHVMNPLFLAADKKRI
ncbi:MAG: sodium:solute symporter [Candidatus Aminicenantes bacterium]|nr:sodium:solute symporter [Candidatus Aminicenantes bacterium]